jgi:hypothetical protein
MSRVSIRLSNGNDITTDIDNIALEKSKEGYYLRINGILIGEIPLFQYEMTQHDMENRDNGLVY